MSAIATQASEKAAKEVAAADERLAEMQRELEEQRRKVGRGAGWLVSRLAPATAACHVPCRGCK